MENSNYTDEQVDAYIMGLMDEQQKKLFEKELKSNTNLTPHLKDRKELILGIEEFYAQEFRNKLKKIHSKSFDNPSIQVSKKRTLLPWFAAAATFALLVVALMWLNNSSQSSAQLFANNFERYDLSLTKRDATNEDLLKLEDLYNKGEYAAALPMFESLIQTSENSAQLKLGAGISKLALGQSNDALVFFDEILKSGDLLFKDHAIWYSALAHLNIGDVEKAKGFLQRLAKDKDADHHQEAMEVLNELK